MNQRQALQRGKVYVTATVRTAAAANWRGTAIASAAVRHVKA
ncbi:MAG: hypothetical protein V3T83_00190 [Acidobacteriota bacterium]